jgi:hypothetical protein
MRNTQKSVDSLHQALNVIEDLVREEVSKQIRTVHPSMREYINPVEVLTYALNRLPPLYACSEKGKSQQTLLAKKEYREKISISVRQALIAVQRDPLRKSQPLVSEIAENYQQAQTALQDLQRFLDKHDLSDYQKITWGNLVTMVQKALNRASRVSQRG